MLSTATSASLGASSGVDVMGKSPTYKEKTNGHRKFLLILAFMFPLHKILLYSFATTWVDLLFLIHLQMRGLYTKAISFSEMIISPPPLLISSLVQFISGTTIIIWLQKWCKVSCLISGIEMLIFVLIAVERCLRDRSLEEAAV